MLAAVSGVRPDPVRGIVADTAVIARNGISSTKEWFRATWWGCRLMAT
ncbi:hypothetical protein [Streptomyces sp. NBC_00989]|nr:hypothetical protein OG714_43380 [Streptomyces sp. NBC_00989]